MQDNRPISQIYAEEGAKWAEAEALASILEDTKSAFLAQKIAELGDMAYNRAEALVKASKEWADRVKETVDARKQANHRKVRLESIRMAHGEFQSEAANERHRNRLEQ